MLSRVERIRLQGNFSYLVGEGPLSADVRTGEPSRQVGVLFEDHDTGNVVEVLLGVETARALAEGIIGQVDSGGIIIPGANGDARMNGGG